MEREVPMFLLLPFIVNDTDAILERVAERLGVGEAQILPDPLAL